MPSELPRLFLARHGDTAWTDSRQRTGRTDIPLNAVGEDRARQFGKRLRRFTFASVFTSPLQRASKTCELAGFGAVATVDSDLVEWDYGRYGVRSQKGVTPKAMLVRIFLMPSGGQSTWMISSWDGSRHGSTS